MDTSESPPCEACGKPIDLTDRDAYVTRPQGLTGRVYWHAVCFHEPLESFLDALR